MAKALLHYPKQSNKIVVQQMPLLTDSVSLVGKDSWTLLQLLNIDHGFFMADLKSWQQNSGCITSCNFVQKPKCCQWMCPWCANSV